MSTADRVRAPGSRTGLADYIPAPDQAVNMFQQVYQSMQVVAQDVNVTIRMVQGLEAVDEALARVGVEGAASGHGGGSRR